jgi:hypothetical protein
MFKFVAHVYCHTSDIQLALRLVALAGSPTATFNGSSSRKAVEQRAFASANTTPCVNGLANLHKRISDIAGRSH